MGSTFPAPVESKPFPRQLVSVVETADVDRRTYSCYARNSSALAMPTRERADLIANPTAPRAVKGSAKEDSVPGDGYRLQYGALAFLSCLIPSQGLLHMHLASGVSPGFSIMYSPQRTRAFWSPQAWLRRWSSASLCAPVVHGPRCPTRADAIVDKRGESDLFTLSRSLLCRRRQREPLIVIPPEQEQSPERRASPRSRGVPTIARTRGTSTDARMCHRAYS